MSLGSNQKPVHFHQCSTIRIIKNKTDPFNDIAHFLKPTLTSFGNMQLQHQLFTWIISESLCSPDVLTNTPVPTEKNTMITFKTQIYHMDIYKCMYLNCTAPCEHNLKKLSEANKLFQVFHHYSRCKKKCKTGIPK